MPTEEEVQQQRERVDSLRQQVREQAANRSGEADEKSREIQMERLKAEEERLQARLGQEPATPTTPVPPTSGSERPSRLGQERTDEDNSDE